MTKKQMKKFATEMATLEFTIQTSADTNAVSVSEAKNKQMKLTETADLTLDQMLELDGMIAERLSKMLAG